MLFVAATINLPLFVAQTVMLALAGFAPWRNLPGLLWMQLSLIVLFLLPASALAAVTAKLAQMLAAALWVGLHAAFLASLPRITPAGEMPAGGDPVNWLVPAVIAAGCAVVIVRQYARRSTIWGRWVLQGVVLAVFLRLSTLPQAR